MRTPTLLLVCSLSNSLAVPTSSGQLVQVRQDFSRDPGWDHHQNRIVGTGMPAVVQDFGWRRTGFTRGPGEIGGGGGETRGAAYLPRPLGQPPALRRGPSPPGEPGAAAGGRPRGGEGGVF